MITEKPIAYEIEGELNRVFMYDDSLEICEKLEQQSKDSNYDYWLMEASTHIQSMYSDYKNLARLTAAYMEIMADMFDEFDSIEKGEI